jgi:agmatine/peptidylarginine deiminase
MILKKFSLAVLSVALLLASCTPTEKPSEIIEQSNLKHQHNRVSAEWEPALGTIVVWPLDLPHQLIIELSKDAKLFTMVPNQEEIAVAKEWYSKWGIDLNNVEFIVSKQGLDSWWARDWGAFAVFDSLGNMSLADGQYEYSTPVSGMACDDTLRFLFTETDKKTGKETIILTSDDDDTPIDIAKHMNYNRIDLPFTYTGGNVFMDGQGSAISCCVIKNENKYIGVSDEQLVADAQSYLGIDVYNFISNFEHSGIQHIDCLLKMLDNNRLFVMQPPVDHELYQVYEDIVNNELSALKNAKGEPFEIIRLNTNRYSGDKLAAYSNSLILNKNIYVPMFGIEQDEIALEQWRAAMPGYTVKGYLYNVHEEPMLHPRVRERRADGFGWRDGDALHCRTRAIWDPEMLYIALNGNEKKIAENYVIEANIIDYSNSGLVRKDLNLVWREKGSEQWTNLPMQETEKLNIYKASFENMPTGTEVEYYITATTAKGKTQTLPMTAPEGLYNFIIE